MYTLQKQDRLFGLALTEIPRAHLRVACLALGAIAIQAALVAAYLALPAALESRGILLPAEANALLDLTQAGSLGAWFAGALCILGALLCLAQARIDRTGPKPSGVWKWGAMAFGLLAINATCNLSGLLSQYLGSVAGAPWSSEILIPAGFLLFFGGFFGIVLWRLRTTPLAACSLLLGYAAWGLAWYGVGNLKGVSLQLSAATEAALVPALAMLGTTLILWSFAGNLLASAQRNTPLALRQRPRLL